MKTDELTDKQHAAIRIAVAELAGVTPMYYLLKRGLYWRPNSKGYTQSKSEAGLYTYEEAKNREHLNTPPDPDDDVLMEPADIHNYPADLNAVMKVVMQLTDSGERSDDCFAGCYWQSLRQVTGWPDVIYSSDECHDDYMHSIVNATATQRCIAILKVKAPDKWEVIKNNP